MIPTPYKQIPWPCNNTFKRKAPGLAVEGRSWTHVELDRVPYLIGDIFNDLSPEYTVLGIAIDYTRDAKNHVTCTITITDFLIKLVALHAAEWQHLKHFTNAFIAVNEGREIPTQYIECEREGLYWQVPLVSHF